MTGATLGGLKLQCIAIAIFSSSFSVTFDDRKLKLNLQILFKSSYYSLRSCEIRTFHWKAFYHRVNTVEILQSFLYVRWMLTIDAKYIRCMSRQINLQCAFSVSVVSVNWTHALSHARHQSVDDVLLSASGAIAIPWRRVGPCLLLVDAQPRLHNCSMTTALVTWSQASVSVTAWLSYMC